MSLEYKNNDKFARKERNIKRKAIDKNGTGKAVKFTG